MSGHGVGGAREEGGGEDDEGVELHGCTEREMAENASVLLSW